MDGAYLRCGCGGALDYPASRVFGRAEPAVGCDAAAYHASGSGALLSEPPSPSGGATGGSVLVEKLHDRSHCLQRRGRGRPEDHLELRETGIKE